VLHHVSLEIRAEQAASCVDFWRLLGFEPVAAPEQIAGVVTWLQRGGTHIHLIHVEAPMVPVLGHAAVVVDDFERTVEAIDAAGHDVEPATRLWGEPRAFVNTPAGHRVELMAAPP
jgi:catechol 2,3-dioxygenase-like lactoylglutathione lyase family enzyme